MTPERLTEVLRAAGAVREAAVVDVAVEPVGGGVASSGARLRLAYDRPESDAPRTVIAKRAGASARSRLLAERERHHEREARFYEQLAPTAGVRVPRLLHGGDGVLLLEDLAPAVAVDQVAGCTPDQAALALEHAAALHAARWGDPALERLDWLHVAPAAHERRASSLPVLHAAFEGRYGHALSPEHLAVGRAVVPRLESYYAAHARPWSIQHGDFRLGNLLFDARGGEVPLAILDWQTVALGPGMVDVSYFLGAGLTVEARRECEEDLVRHYRAALVAGGVEGCSWSRCWEEYRRHAYAGYLLAMAAAIVLEPEPAGEELLLTMVRRHATHALDSGSAALIGG